MNPHKHNLKNDFISAWLPDDTSICDDLINYFEQNPEKHQGRIRGGIDTNVKDSTDCHLTSQPLWDRYVIDYLQPVVEEYKKQYRWCNEFGPWTVIEHVNIQHYKPGQGYPAWHTERGSALTPNCNRHLVFMTYLNNVTDSGETEWYHQDIKIQPQKGLTVIWPADWCFVHRGNITPTQDKYIITGWFNYTEK